MVPVWALIVAQEGEPGLFLAEFSPMPYFLAILNGAGRKV